jgi:two-component system phosphate regulon sensor histidine kinase PhoR
MRPLSSGIRWLLVAGSLLILVLVATISYQHRVVRSQVETGLKAELFNECKIIAAILNSGSVFNYGNLSIQDRRITIIGLDGVVQFDSESDLSQMGNHNDRPEVILARRDGVGYSARYSETLHYDLIYVAMLIPDQRVVRVSAPLKLEDGMVSASSLPVIMTTGILIIGGGLTLVFFLWRSRFRVAELVEVSRAFAMGDFGRRAALIGNDAFALLGHELNHLGERLRESNERIARQRELLNGALGTLAEGVACIDHLDRVVYANSAYRQFAAGGSEVEGQEYYRHIAADGISEAISNLRNGISIQLLQLPFEHRRRHLQAMVAHGGQGVAVIVLHDRTELVRAEAARRDFLSAVSHELKTPLTAIVGYTDTLLDGALESSPADARGFIQAIGRHSERLTELVRDVLTLTRLEQGSWEVRPQEVDLVQLMDTILEDHRSAAQQRNVNLSLNAPHHLDGSTDPELIRQLVGNLISNAIRYNRPDGTVFISLDFPDDEFVKITVKDTGIGIPKEHQDRIFERFYRVDMHRSRSSGGTGLGLAIVKHLVEVLNGSIFLQSGVDGTTFTVNLPRRMDDKILALKHRVLASRI